MGKLYLKDFSIEITRRCNMVCAHCLRGDAEALDIDHRHIRNVLRHIRHIQHFNITGGEPSLNVKAIRYILTQLRSFGITVNHFDLTTTAPCLQCHRNLSAYAPNCTTIRRRIKAMAAKCSI